MTSNDSDQRPDPLVGIGSAEESFALEAYEEFASLCAAGVPIALVTVVGCQGSTPRGMGAAMAVKADGSIVGTIGGGELELRAIEQAQAALRDHRPRRLHYDFSGRIDQNPARNLGMACAGTVDLFVQPSAAGPSLTICGAGHVSMALAPMAMQAGFQVTVIDNRPGRPDPSDYNEYTRLVSGPYAECLPELEFDAENTYLVIVTHGHAHDSEVLAACLHQPWRYLGMIGSRAKVAQVFGDLGKTAEARELLARVHAPIGLDLGGRSPAEIAVSILAEMVAVRHGRQDVSSMKAAPGSP